MPSAPSADQALAHASLPDHVQDALRGLPDEYRAAVVLCDVVGFGYQEIADTLEHTGGHRSQPHPSRPRAAPGGVGVTQPDDTVASFELLDAYADGELTETRASGGRRAARANRPKARAELADIERVRGLVRGLPEVDAPVRVLRTAPARPTARTSARVVGDELPGVVFASTVGAVAAAVVLVVAITPMGDRLAPPVDDLSQRHAMLASSLASSSHEMPAGYDAMPDDAARLDGALRGARHHRARLPPGSRLSSARRPTRAVSQRHRNRLGVRTAGSGANGTAFRPAARGCRWTATTRGPTRWPTVQASPTTDGRGRAGTRRSDRHGVGSAPHDDVVAVAEAVPEPARAVDDRARRGHVWTGSPKGSGSRPDGPVERPF